MSTLNTAKVPLAVESHCKLDLPFDHATTSMFMLLQPVYYRHCFRTEKDVFKLTSVVRPNPIVTPTFGRIRQNLRAFFVPYRLVFPNWEEFGQSVIASNYGNSSQVLGVPVIKSDEILNMFIMNVGDLVVEHTIEPTLWDFKTATKWYTFTRKGRNFYKILYCLGYDLLPADKDFYFNVIILLAYCRVYLDWYANSQYLNSAFVLSLEQKMKFNDPTSQLVLSKSDLYQMLNFILPATYNTNGYFEGAWDNPVAPSANQFTGFTFVDPTSSNGSVVSTNSNGTPEMYQSGSSSTSIGTAYLHEALKKLSQYQRRHALSGARAIDRVLADYGIQTDHLRQSRSIYVGVQSNDIDIKAIFATADGSNGLSSSTVGDFAGAGLGAGSQLWNYQNDEQGVFIVVQTIQPSGGYYQGYDRMNRLLTRSEFYQPAFDTLGVQAIEKGEVYVSKDLSGSFASKASDYAGVFGFTGRYGEMKRSINRVSGDLAIKSALVGGNSWHLMREFDDAYFGCNVANIVHSEDFCRGSDAENYLRIFSYTDYEIDPFNVFIHVDCAAFAPCHPLTDTFDWDTDAPNVRIDVNGPKLN